MALLLGFCTDTMPFALALGLALELFWIDLLRLGTIIPPSGTFSFLLLYPICLLFQWELPSTLPLPLCICLIAGYGASLLERWQRRANAQYDAALEAWAMQNPDDGNQEGKDDVRENALQQAQLSPSLIISRARWRVLWSSALLYLGVFGCVYALLSWLETKHAVPIFPHFNWYMLYAIALIGPILALRTRRAYRVLALGIICLLFWVFAS